MPLFGEKKPKKLNAREAHFFKLLSENPTMTISDAGRIAGYAEGTVRSNLYQKLQAKASNPLRKALEKAGLTEEKIAERMSQGVDSFKTRVFQEKVYDKDTGKTTFKYHKENQVDFMTRKHYIELLGRFRGDLNQEDAPISNTVSIENVIISKEVDILQATQIYQATLRDED